MEEDGFEVDVNKQISKEFPFYHVWYEKGYIRGCVKASKISCNTCIVNTLCLCRSK